jgi:hypothetical protein
VSATLPWHGAKFGGHRPRDFVVAGVELQQMLRRQKRVGWQFAFQAVVIQVQVHQHRDVELAG